MEHFSYLENLEHDIWTYMQENDEYFFGMYADRNISKDDWIDKMEQELWAEDSVTGNGSGSYTFSREESKQNVLADFDTVVNELWSSGICTDEEAGKHFLNSDWEWFDVTIRCLLLRDALADVANELDKNNIKMNNEPYFLVDAFWDVDREIPVTYDDVLEAYRREVSENGKDAVGSFHHFLYDGCLSKNGSLITWEAHTKNIDKLLRDEAEADAEALLLQE